MSNSFFQGGAVAETYVSIVPRVDQASFQRDAEGQVAAALPDELTVPVKATVDTTDLAAQKDQLAAAPLEVPVEPVLDKAAIVEQGAALPPLAVPVKPVLDTAALQTQAGTVGGSALTIPVKATLDTADLAKQRNAAFAEAEVAFAAAQTTSAKNLIGQASTLEATAALEKYSAAAIVAAEADVKLALATGQTNDSYRTSIALLERLQLEQRRASNPPGGPPGGPPDGPGRRPPRGARGLLEEVGQGRLGVAEFARFIPQIAAGVVAFEAYRKITEKVTDALKVEGDAAFTTEGRFRNLGAALVSGDVVGGFDALIAKAPTVKERLDALLASGEATGATLDILGSKADKSAAELEKVAAAGDKLGKNDALSRTIKEAADDMGEAADKAHALADAFREGEQAANDVATAIRNAGSEAAAFGEQSGPEGRGPGANARSRGAGFSSVDETQTDANENAVADSIAQRKQGLARAKAELENARAVEQQAKESEANQQEIVKGRAERHRATVEATTKRIQAEQAVAAEEKRIKDAADAQAKKDADDAKRAREKRKRDQEQEARERAQELRDTLDYREQVLQDALTEAQATEATVKDDRAALRKLIAFEHEKSQNRKLTLSERETAAQAEREYRRQLNQVNKTQLANALQVREQNLRNAIEQAKLTTGTADDDKANAAFLKFLQNQVKRAKGDALAVAKAKGDVIAFKQQLQGGNANGGGFTLNDLFKAATDNFDTFGSNIGDRDAPLSGQDERGKFGAAVVGNVERLAGRQLTETERQTGILASIDRKIGRLSPGAAVAAKAAKGGYGSLQAERAVAMAAAYGYGVN